MAVNVLLPLLIPLGEQITNGTGNLYFTKSTYEATVEENLAPADLVSLKAHSNTTVGVVSYRLIGGSPDGIFSADPKTGQVSLTKPLDFEYQDIYELIVGAQTGQERAFARVLIKVDDVNDNAPTFSRPLYETQMTEEDDRHLPKSILRVTASDRDSVDEGKLTYYLRGDGVASTPSYSDLPDPLYALVPSSTTKQQPALNPASSSTVLPQREIPSSTRPSHKVGSSESGGRAVRRRHTTFFSINSTNGDIQLLHPLDRDAPNGRAKWILKIGVTDGIHDAQTTLHVNVKDINDNPPFFPDDVMEGRVAENAPAGAEVVTVRAIDLDDPNEGTHAHLSFTLEKNVIDEATGRPLFAIGRHTGRITTALCCLDREKTPSFAIQVVATDGGGLKGSGSVTVQVTDENDVAPRFGVEEWRVAVHEGARVNQSLALITVKDPDLNNTFQFRIVPESGFGWDKFVLVPSPPDAGSLRALEPLDYEDPEQQKGFKFKVQVTDQGDDWSDPTHQDVLWAIVSLLDDNDNAPRMKTTFVNLSLPEDIQQGRLLAEFPAVDADQDGKEEVSYSIDPATDRRRRFRIDKVGRVRLRRKLDREVEAAHTLRILATDGGKPPRTATGSLYITVTDVNDNPPFIKGPSTLFLRENAGPKHLADVFLGDPDDWNRGNGPPFKIRMDEKAPPAIRRSFAIRFLPSGDSGRGIGVVSSLQPMDREERPLRFIPVVVMDAKGLSATVTLSVTLGDVNDNPMAPGVKTVNVTRIKSETGTIPLGRVFVEDPDDWDFRDKTWRWMHDFPHPFFSLDGHTGQLSVSPDVPDDEYKLHFRVSDQTHGQFDVPANVTVRISSLDIEDESNPAVPLLILSHSAEQLVTSNQIQAVSPIQSLLEAIKSVLDLEVRVLALEHQQEGSFQELPSRTPKPHLRQEPKSTSGPFISFDFDRDTKFGNDVVPSGHYNSRGQEENYFPPVAQGPRWTKNLRDPFSNTPTTLWVMSKTRRPLDQLLLINRAKISDISGVRIGDVGVGVCAHFEPILGPSVRRRHKQALQKGGSNRGSWVVDANSTALVTPKVWAGVGCICRRRNSGASNGLPRLPSQPLQVRNSNSAVPSCHPDPCFNGGRCISSLKGPKCICPEHTDGPLCKQRSRFFGKGGWAWVDPIPSCSNAHVSLQILTRNPHGIILYTGPGPDQPRGLDGNHPLLEEDILSLELRNGLPRLLVDLGAHPIVISPSGAPKEKPGTTSKPSAAALSREDLQRRRKKESKRKVQGTPATLADGKWHRLDLLWGANTIELLIDLCRGNLKECHIKARLPPHRSPLRLAENGTSHQNFAPRTPLQIGGLAYPPPDPVKRGWTEPLSHSSFDGCIKNLRINGRLVDLGNDLLSNNSKGGCPQGNFCRTTNEKCLKMKQCETSSHSSCTCLPGWSGTRCDVRTEPSSFGKGSYVRVALSFLPSKTSTAIDLRFRSWSAGGQLILVTSQHSRDQFSLYLEEGHMCLLLALRSPLSKLGFSSSIVAPPLTLCLTRVTLNDGQWHDVRAYRYGRWCELLVDSGEWPLYNASFTPSMNRPPIPEPDPEDPLSLVESEFHLRRMEEREWGSHPFVIDRQEGIHIGGVPEYVGVSLLTVNQDFVHGCIDDVRLNGHPLPLPPGLNTSKWAQATTFGSSVTSSCSGTPVCFNISCPPPLICVDLWRKHQCGCGEGKVLSSDSASCQDVNECIWKPCLNGGTCLNESPSYSCVCPRGFLGDNCEMAGVQESSISLSVGVIAGIITWFSVFLVIVVAYALRQRIRKANKRKDSERRGSPEKSSSNSSDFLTATQAENPHLGCSRPQMLELRVEEPNVNGDPAWKKKTTAESEVDVLRVDTSPALEPSSHRGSHRPLHRLRSASKSAATSRASSPPKTTSNRCWRAGKIKNGRGGRGGGGVAAKKLSETGSRDEDDHEKGNPLHLQKEGGAGKGVGGGTKHIVHSDDLRNYAYEGGGSSPGSLSSCCSGHDGTGGIGMLLGGFQDVALLLNCLGNDSRPQMTSELTGIDQQIKSSGHSGVTAKCPSIGVSPALVECLNDSPKEKDSTTRLPFQQPRRSYSEKELSPVDPVLIPAKDPFPVCTHYHLHQNPAQRDTSWQYHFTTDDCSTLKCRCGAYSSTSNPKEEEKSSRPRPSQGEEVLCVVCTSKEGSKFLKKVRSNSLQCDCLTFPRSGESKPKTMCLN